MEVNADNFLRDEENSSSNDHLLLKKNTWTEHMNDKEFSRKLRRKGIFKSMIIKLKNSLEVNDETVLGESKTNMTYRR